MDTSWLRKTVQAFEPYEVAPITVPIVINANESYQSLWDFPEVKKDLQNELEKTATNLYPLPYADGLRQAIADYVGKKPENILIGNGGDEIISLITQAFIDKEDSIVVHSPTFDMYEVGATSMGAKAYKVGDAEDLSHDLVALLDTIKKVQPKVVYLCNPNNPTGQLWQREDLLKIIATAPKVVVLDEAYMEFNDNEGSLIPELENYPNVVILRTLSKAFSLAGARVGYLVGSAEAIKLVSKVKAPYNMNVFSQAVGRVALRHQDIMKALVKTIQKNRVDLYNALQASTSADFTVFKSVTNFIFIRTTKAADIARALKANGILIKSYRAGSDLENYLRITVTTAENNQKLVDTIKNVLGK